MLSCLLPAIHFADGTVVPIAISAAITMIVGMIFVTKPFSNYFNRRINMSTTRKHSETSNKRMAYVAVALVWVLLVLFGMLPFLLTLSTTSVSDALFESMSGLTSTGATIFADVESLPPSILFWRSVSQWIGGFGIILLVLAIVPSLHINKYSLYTAEASGADNSGKTTTSTRSMVRQTLAVYLCLTLFFIVVLRLSGMTLWEASNITFTNISTGGFSIYGDSIARFTPLQQYILAASMFLGGVNFAVLYNLFTFKWSRLKNKLDQFGFYCAIAFVSVLAVFGVLRVHHELPWDEALRDAVVQTLSVLTTTGSVVADTTQWWTPILLMFLILSFCGGMAGSTTGGIKIMRVLILFRNVGNALLSRLHPHAYNPVRLNGKPVSNDIITNVMVIFVVMCTTMLFSLLALLICGVESTEALGAVFGCLTSYGPGLGASGGFGSYAAFPMVAKWICSVLMLLGRLECLTILILFLPGFWRK